MLTKIKGRIEVVVWVILSILLVNYYKTTPRQLVGKMIEWSFLVLSYDMLQRRMNKVKQNAN